MKLLNLETFQKAEKALRDDILETGLIYSESFTQKTGNRVWFKPENMQLTGAYKIRGAMNKISCLSPEQRERGLITSSAGNHAQGVAYAARRFHAKATIVMPETTPLVKINSTKAYGAEIVLHGNLYDDAYEYAMQLAEKNGYEFIHPFNDLDVAAGQGTLAFEILRDLPEVDVILVPVGGGGLIAGVATLAKILKPEITIIGVEPSGAACMLRSLREGEVTSLMKVETIADGVAVRTPGDVVFPYVKEFVDDIITIDDPKLVDVFLDMMENHKMIVENAGLLSVAALKYIDMRDKNVVAILSGGNMDVITISSLVQHGLRNRGRIFSFCTFLPDRPGELHRISGIIAREKGNIIELEHNQFVDINRNSSTGLELRITLEAFGHEHKNMILVALSQEGYTIKAG